MTRFFRISSFFAAVVLCFLTAGAHTSWLPDTTATQLPPIYDTSRPLKVVRFTPVVSVGGASSINNYQSVIPGLTDMQTAPGLVLRAGVHVNFFIHRSLALVTGLEGSVNNSRVALGIINESSNTIGSIYITHNYWEATVPVYVNIYHNLGWRIKGTVGIGAYLAQGLGGTTKASGYTSGMNSLGQSVIDHLYYSKDYYSEEMSVVNSVKRFDFGPRISAGLLLRNRVSMNMVFQISAQNLAVNHNVLDIKYRHVSLAMEIGYYF